MQTPTTLTSGRGRAVPFPSLPLSPGAAASPAKVYRTAFPARKDYLNAQAKTVLDQRLVLVLQHNNLTFSEWIATRRALAQRGVRVLVVRNVLMRAQITNTRYEAMQPLFAGPTALAYADDDDVAAAVRGVLETVARTPKLLVVGGKVESSLVAADDLARITRLPGLAHLRAEVVATLQGPMTLLAAILQQTPQTLVSNLQVVATRADADAAPAAKA